MIAQMMLSVLCQALPYFPTVNKDKQTDGHHQSGCKDKTFWLLLHLFNKDIPSIFQECFCQKAYKCVPYSTPNRLLGFPDVVRQGETLTYRSHFSRCSRKRICTSILKNRESPPNGVISLSTNFISQSIIKSCSFQTVVKLANIYELSIYRKAFLMADIRKRKKPYL